MSEPEVTLVQPRARRRHRRSLVLTSNRAVVPALAAAIDRLDPDHPNYAFWQEHRHMLAVALEVLG